MGAACSNLDPADSLPFKEMQSKFDKFHSGVAFLETEGKFPIIYCSPGFSVPFLTKPSMLSKKSAMFLSFPTQETSSFSEASDVALKKLKKMVKPDRVNEYRWDFRNIQTRKFSATILIVPHLLDGRVIVQIILPVPQEEDLIRSSYLKTKKLTSDDAVAKSSTPPAVSSTPPTFSPLAPPIVAPVLASTPPPLVSSAPPPSHSSTPPPSPSTAPPPSPSSGGFRTSSRSSLKIQRSSSNSMGNKKDSGGGNGSGDGASMFGIFDSANDPLPARNTVVTESAKEHKDDSLMLLDSITAIATSIDDSGLIRKFKENVSSIKNHVELLSNAYESELDSIHNRLASERKSYSSNSKEIDKMFRQSLAKTSSQTQRIAVLENENKRLLGKIERWGNIVKDVVVGLDSEQRSAENA